MKFNCQYIFLKVFVIVKMTRLMRPPTPLFRRGAQVVSHEMFPACPCDIQAGSYVVA